MSPCGSEAGGRHVSRMKRVDTRVATTSRGAEGRGPAGAAARWSLVALVSEVGGNVGMATSWHVQTLGNMKGKHHHGLKKKENRKKNVKEINKTTMGNRRKRTHKKGH